MALTAGRVARLLPRCTAAAGLQPQDVGLLAAAAQRLVDCTRQHQCVRWMQAASWQGDQHGRDSEMQRKALVNRMLYRSKQRGFLELDLLIGLWAENEVPKMSVDLIREFEVVLDQENPEMFKWLTAQEEPPEEMRRNRAFQALQAHVKQLTDRHHSVPRAAKESPKEWVRGWTDTGRELTGAGGGNSSNDSDSSSSRVIGSMSGGGASSSDRSSQAGGS